MDIESEAHAPKPLTSSFNRTILGRSDCSTLFSAGLNIFHISAFLLAFMFHMPAAAQSPATERVTLSSDGYTGLFEDRADTGPPDRTPLILIHGVHGNSPPCSDEDTLANPYRDYWKGFLEFFMPQSGPGLRLKYKTYRFHYLSDKISVPDIAKDLGEVLEANPDLRNKSIVIVAHSTGGLVARSYMNEYTQLAPGTFQNKLGGERVLTLITLASPHHGSPFAMDTDLPPVNYTRDN